MPRKIKTRVVGKAFMARLATELPMFGETALTPEQQAQRLMMGRNVMCVDTRRQLKLMQLRQRLQQKALKLR
jgi:hypothetical protein